MRARLCLVATLCAAGFALAQTPPAPVKPQFAGPTPDGFLLPSGWKLTPAGTHVETSDLPLNIIPSKDGKRALVATCGFQTSTTST